MKQKLILVIILIAAFWAINNDTNYIKAEKAQTYRVFDIEFALNDGKLTDTQAEVLLFMVKYLDEKKLITIGTMDLWRSLDQYYQGKYLGKIYLTITKTYLDLVTEYFLSCNIPWGFNNFPQYIYASGVFDDWDSYFKIVPCLMYIDISLGFDSKTFRKKNRYRPIYRCKYYIRSFPNIYSYHVIAQYFTNHDEWLVGKITGKKYKTYKRIYDTKNEARNGVLPTIKEKLDEWKEKERYRKPFKKADFAKGLDETLSVILDKVPKKDSIFISGEWDNTLLGIFKIKSRLDYYFGEEVSLIICKNLKGTLYKMLRTKEGKRNLRDACDSLGIH